MGYMYSDYQENSEEENEENGSADNGFACKSVWILTSADRKRKLRSMSCKKVQKYFAIA